MSAPEEVAAAIDRLESQHDDEVEAAMGFLRAHADQAHDAVLRALREHRSDQANLARLLGEWGRPESVDALRDAVERGAHPLRYAAAMALAQHPDARAARALSELSASQTREVAHVAMLARSARGAG